MKTGLVNTVRNPWAAFAVSVVLHVSLVFILGHYHNPEWMESGGIAENLYDGKGFSAGAKSELRHFDPAAKRRAEERVAAGEPPPFSEMRPTSLHSPGYPFLLYGIWLLLGKHAGAYLVINLLQALLISSLVFPARRLARRWFGPQTAAWAMWIACFLPPYAFYATRMVPVAVFMFLHPWLIVVWLEVRDRPSVLNAVGAGCFTGFAVLFQPLFLAIYGLVGGGLLVERIFRREWAVAARLLAAPLAVVVVLTPWTVRNYHVHHRLVLIRQASDPFWVGNNPNATGTTVVEGGEQDIYVAHPPKCVVHATELSEAEYHAAMKREALDYIRSEPGAFVRRTAKKMFWLWTIVPQKYVARQGLSAAVTFRWVLASYWFSFLGLAIVAGVAGRRFKPEYVFVLAVYIVVCSILYGLLHAGQARFRSEIEFVFIPAAAEGVRVVWTGIRGLFAARQAVG